MTQEEKDELIHEIESLKDNGKYNDKYDCGFKDGNLSAILGVIEIIQDFKTE